MGLRFNISRFLIIGLVLWLTTPGAALDLKKGEEVEVIARVLDVRVGAGVEMVLMDRILNGTQLTILDQSVTKPQWYKVSYTKDGRRREGWISTLDSSGNPTVKTVKAKRRPTSPPPQDSVRIHIVENQSLRKRIEGTDHYRKIIARINQHGAILEPIRWKFTNQSRSILGHIRIVKNEPLVSIDSSRAHLMMPFANFLEVLKPKGVLHPIQIYTQYNQYWFTLYPTDYSIRAEDLRRAALGLPSIPGEGGRTEAEFTTLRAQHIQLKNEYNKAALERDSLKAGKTRFENRLKALEEERNNLRAQLEKYLEKEIATIIPTVGDSQATTPLSDKLEQIKAESNNLRVELDRLQKRAGSMQGRELEKEVETLRRRLQTLQKQRDDFMKKVNGFIQAETKQWNQTGAQLQRTLNDADQEIQELKQRSSRVAIADWIRFQLNTNQRLSESHDLLLPNSNQQMKFVFVKKGHFPMGLTKTELNLLIRESQNPTYDYLEIKADREWQEIRNSFLIGKYEVTNAEYHALNPNHQYMSTDARKPVTNLSDKEIRAFCKALDAAYPQLDIRLPTEREWEYAARGHSSNPYTWGKQFDRSKANVDSNRLMAVGQYPASNSWCGASDMVGNAKEVCEIDTENYVKKVGQKWVARGGSYTSDQYNSRVTARYLLWNPKDRSIGFRVLIQLKR